MCHEKGIVHSWEHPGCWRDGLSRGCRVENRCDLTAGKERTRGEDRKKQLSKRQMEGSDVHLEQSLPEARDIRLRYLS